MCSLSSGVVANVEVEEHSEVLFPPLPSSAFGWTENAGPENEGPQKHGPENGGQV